jgi:hypothetical protein
LWLFYLFLFSPLGACLLNEISSNEENEEDEEEEEETDDATA